MRCVDVCPTAAMKIDPRRIDDCLCIMCAACIRACPEGVLSVYWDDSPKSRETFERFDKIFVRKEPKIYI